MIFEAKRLKVLALGCLMQFPSKFVSEWPDGVTLQNLSLSMIVCLI